MKKIAIIETSFVGDLAFLFPFFNALKRSFPESEITLITTPAPAKIAPLSSSIDKVVVFDKKGKDKFPAYYHIKSKVEKKYDFLFATHRFGSTKILSRFYIKAEKKIGFKSPLCRESFDICVPYPNTLKVEERPFELLKALEIFPEKKDFYPQLNLTLIDHLTKDLNLPSKYVFIVPGSQWETKRWIPGFYAILTQWIHQSGYPVYTGGSPSERDLLQEIRKLSNNKIKVLETDLTTMGAVILKSSLLIGNDTGPVHLGRIGGVPTIAIFGPTPSGIFRWEQNQFPIYLNGLRCRPCHHHGPRHCPRGDFSCMFELKPEMVWDKVRWILENS